jgi:dinuclear metal center YbgI/SA1388 family protein
MGAVAVAAGKVGGGNAGADAGKRATVSAAGAPRCSHSGLSVDTTKNKATATVTVWEKISHVLRINEILNIMVPRTELDTYLSTLLAVEKFHDYGPNGIQVEGKPEVKHLVSGVTASLALIEVAVAQGADALLVHHGLFWKGHDGRLTGWLKKRVALLLAHDITLLAYHLPLDAHEVHGNNAQLGALFECTPFARFGDQNLGVIGKPEKDLTLSKFVDLVAQKLGRTPLVVGGTPGQLFKRVAWCSGGAQSYFEAAIAAGADVFVTGEISEPQAHLARETGVVFMACGHHATERYGAQALGQHVAQRFGLTHQFIDIDNPA